MIQHLTRVVRNSLLYAIANGTRRAVPFLLIPVYAAFLGTEGYGILGVTNAFQNLLRVVFIFTSGNVIIRFYYELRDDVERRQFLGGFWLLLTLLMLLFALFFELAGPSLFDFLFRDVSYRPYGRYIVWTAFVTILSSGISINLFKARQQPKRYMRFITASAFLQITLIVYFIVVRGEGVVGVLKGMFYAAILLVPVYGFVLYRDIAIAWPWRKLRQAILFGFPLVPELVALWTLNMSDRIILNNHVSLRELGIYSLGYQLGMMVNLLVNAIDSAWLPYFLSLVDDEDTSKRRELPRLTTYVFGGLAFVGVGVALLAGPLIRLITTPDFHRATQVAPWIAAGYVALGFTFIARSSLIYRQETKYIAIASVVAALTNVGLNWVLIPYWGIMAAAVSTLVSYAILLVAMMCLAQYAGITLYYEKAHAVRLLLFCVFSYVLAASVHLSSPILEAIVRVLIVAGIALAWLRSVGPFERIGISWGKAARKAANEC